MVIFLRPRKIFSGTLPCRPTMIASMYIRVFIKKPTLGPDLCQSEDKEKNEKRGNNEEKSRSIKKSYIFFARPKIMRWLEQIRDIFRTEQISAANSRLQDRESFAYSRAAPPSTRRSAGRGVPTISIRKWSFIDLNWRKAVRICPVPELAVLVHAPSPERPVLLDRHGVLPAGRD